MKSVNEEIQIIENVIRLLFQCLKMNIDASNSLAIKNCMRDIRICKTELKRLQDIHQSKAAAEVRNEALGDALQ